MISFFLLISSIFLVQSQELKSLPLHFIQTLRPIPRLLATTTFNNATFEASYITASSSFVVPIDLGTAYKTAFSITTTTYMYVYISSSETALYSGCTNYASYTCSSTWCTTSGTGFSFILPFGQSGTANLITPTLTMVGNGWKVTRPALFFTTTTCDFAYPTQSSTSTGTYGWLGLGINGTAATNFQTTLPIFSISISSTTKTGSIIFGLDPTKYNACISPVTLSADLDWQMTVAQISLGTNQLIGFAYKLIFDLQQDGIVFPSPFQQFMTFFTTTYSFTCATSAFNACTWSGSLSALPSLVFTMSNSVTLTFAPADYMIFVQTVNSVNQYRLLIQIASNNNYFVLGWEVLANYYVVFEQLTTGPIVYVYDLYDSSASCGDDDVNPLGYIIGFAVFTVFFLGGIIFIIKQAQSQKKMKQKYLAAVAMSNLDLKGVNNTTINPSNISLGRI